jgi:hypothetical protein
MRVPLPAAMMTIWSDMQRSSVNRRIIAIALVVATLLSGCSVALKLTYNQGPALLYWWMDGYADFTDEQKPRVKQLIEQWFAWNRRDALPDYARVLQRMGTEVQNPTLTPQAMCGAATEVKQRLLAAYDMAVPSFAELALSLSPEQIQHMEKRFAKNNAKFRDEFIPSRQDDRVKAQAKKAQERFELVYGSIDDAQRERILQAEAASPYDPELWLTERKAIQFELLQVLRGLQAAKAQGADPQQLTAQAQAGLRAVSQHTEQSPREAYRAQQQRVWNYNCALAAQVHNTMTPEQRQYAARKIQRWVDDVQSLHAAREG